MPKEPILLNYLDSKGRERGIPAGGIFELTPRRNFNCKSLHELQ